MADENKINEVVTKDALRSIEDLKKLLADAQNELLKLLSAGKDLDSKLKDSAKITKLTSQIKKLADNIERLQAAENKLNKASSLLNQSQSSAASSTSKNTSANSKNTSATNSNTNATNKNTSAKKLNSNATNSNTNANKSSLKSIKENIAALLSYAKAYITINAGVRLFNKIVEDTTALDSLNFSLKTVITNTFELAQTKKYLADIIVNFGTDLVETTNSYVRFRAAVGQSNLTVKEGQQIFESVAKASAALGLSQEKTNDVFLALEQMLSKGTIMSEELRRQMGQHLPVAISAMAKAAKDAGLSVSGTTSELFELMKEGKVAAEVILPLFAKRVEEALGIQTLNKVDTLISAQERLNTAWKDFIDGLKAAPALTAAYNKVADFVYGVSDLVRSDEGKIEKGTQSLVSTVNEELNKGNTEQERRVILTEQLNKLIQEQSNIYKGLTADGKMALESQTNGGKTLSNFFKDLYRTGHKKITGIYPTLEEANIASKNLDLISSSYKNAIDLIKANFEDLVKEKEKTDPFNDDKKKDDFSERFNTFKDQLDAEYNAYREHLESMRQQAHKNVVDSGADELNIKRVDSALQMDMDSDLYAFRSKQMVKLIDFAKSHEKEKAEAIKQQTDLSADYQAKYTDWVVSEDKRETDEYLKEIEKRKDAELAAIDETTNSKLLELYDKAKTDALSSKKEYQFEAIDVKLNLDSLNVIKQGYEEMLNVENLTANEIADIEQKLHDTKVAISKAEMAQTEKDAKKRIELQKQAFDYAKQIQNELFNLFLAVQDGQLQRLEWQHEREIALAGDSLAKQIAADTKYDIEKRKIQRRQAILQKAQSAANIAMNTAEAIISIWAEVPKFDFGISATALTAMVGTLGALQLATVMAQPIPAFEEGGQHYGGFARFSEGGKSELFIPDGSDQAYLTPAKETIANMPSGLFIPNEELQSTLAHIGINNMNKEYEIIDLSETNGLLRNMLKKNETFYSNGVKMSKKNNIFGKYVTRN